jgi:Tfp pilus assembly protein PilO
MNHGEHRRAAAHVVIVVAVCIGGWMMLIEPKAAELARMEAAIAQRRASPAATDPAFVQKLADQAQALKARIAAIEARSELATDSSAVYRRIRALAEEHQVNLLSLNPGAARAGSAGEGAQPLSTTRIDLTVEGRYEPVARFIESVAAIDGFIRPASLTLSAVSRGSERLVSAQLACDAIGFTLPDSITVLKGGQSDDGS